MVAFEVSINGKRVCSAGIEADGVLDLTLVYSKRAETVPPIWFSLGALTDEEHLDWITGRARVLKLGDTLEVRVVEAEAVDPPKGRRPAKRA